ncbi:hypothetical protein RZE82_06125 [Mollicutes bacterium LVI A0039]|nr:hypothetical protein RZE82_06125 [Mollicutes bacterium LVI A0039]
MLKIIEINSEVTDEHIYKYSNGYTGNYFEMPEIDGKFTIDSIGDYLSYFTLARDAGDVDVGVIRNGNNLSEYHQNKLLKTFEESDDDQIHLIFIDRSDRLLETILSRSIVYRESITFEFQDTELHNFAKNIVTSIETYDLLMEEDPIFRELYKVNRNLQNGNIDQAIITCSSIKFDYDKYLLLNNLINNHLYATKRLDLLKFGFELELKSRYNVNYGLQVLALLIEIKNSKEYYERSSWN